MQVTTRFNHVEDVIFIEENFTHEYKELQSLLNNYFSFNKVAINNRALFNIKELKCINFDDISHIDKNRLKRQICPIYRLKNSDKALVIVNRGNNNSRLIIKEINDNSFRFYSTVFIGDTGDEETQLCDEGVFHLKYSEYEIVFCIIHKLAKNRLYEDNEEFETQYNFFKKLFSGREKDFLDCLLYPDKLDGYTSYPHDYNQIGNYSELKSKLFALKNNLSITKNNIKCEKTVLVEKYNSITDFKEKLDFWFLNQSAMKFKGNDKSDLIEEYTQICQNNMGSTDRKSEILRIWEEEDFEQGIVEPVPTNDLEKEILVKKHIQIWGLNHLSIPTFEEYKINFNNDVLNQLNKKWYAEKELEIIKTDLDKQCKYEVVILNHPKGGTPRELVYYMTNNNYKIDYPLIYNEYFNKYFYNSLMVRLAQIISKVQYQKFLETYLLNKEYENKSNIEITSSTPKLTKQQIGFNLGYSETQLKALYKALINATFLDNQTEEAHFINAFNGKLLTVDFKPLDWFDYTRGAIFISYFLRKHKNLWSATEHLLVKASYKTLLSQSKGNNTFETVSKELDSIQKQINLLTDINSQ